MAVLGKTQITELNVTNTTGAIVNDLDTGDLIVEGGASVKGNLNVGGTVYATTYENLPKATISNDGGITKLYNQVGSQTDGAITPKGVQDVQTSLNTTITNNYNTLDQKITDTANTINTRIDQEVADLEEKLDNVTVTIETADENTQGITYLYNEANATDQDNGAITPKAVDTKISVALEDYTPTGQSGQSILRSWRKSVRTETEGQVSIQIENYDPEMQVLAFINGMALSAADPKIEYTLNDTGLVTTSNSLNANQDFMVIALYNEVITAPPSQVNNTLTTWRQTITSSGDTSQILSIQIPDYNKETMQVFAYLNGFTLSDGSNSDLVEYTVSDTGLVSTVHEYPKDQDFMVIVFYYGGSASTTKVSDPIINITDNVCTINCSTNGATIYYSIDNPDPLNNGSVYNTSFTLSQNCTIYAIAIKSGNTNSNVVSQTYTQTLPKVANPVINYTQSTSSFTLSCDTPNAIIKYSLNDADPLNNGTVYNNTAVTITSSPTIVYAIATLDNYENSDVVNSECRLKVATPVITIVSDPVTQKVATPVIEIVG